MCWLQLPDGSIIHVGPDRFNVPEVLFQQVKGPPSPVLVGMHNTIDANFSWGSAPMEAFGYLLAAASVLASPCLHWGWREGVGDAHAVFLSPRNDHSCPSG